MKIQSLAYNDDYDDPKKSKKPGAVRPAPSPSGLSVGGGGNSSGSSGITVGTTTITSGTNTKVLFNNSGVVGEYTITGTGNVVMSASPTLTGTAVLENASLSGSINFNSDTYLTRDAANTFAQRNGANAQTLRVYNTYTDASNYERAVAGWSSGVFYLSTDSAGTGSGRSLALNGTTLDFRTGGTGVTGGGMRWQVNGNGHLVTGADNAYDIGASGATRPRNVYVGTNIFAGNNVDATNFTFSAGARGYINSPSNGVFGFYNASGTDFDRLQFGGTSASFVAWKRVLATFQARLADDSAFAGVQSLYIRFGSGSPEGAVTAPVGAIYSRTDGGAGTSFYVKESGTGNTGWVAK